jgi:hypothetical protein
LGSALLIGLLLLIYFQLRFYREGDLKHARSQGEPVSADISSAPGYLKSPHHRAIWKNMDQTRNLMRLKEKDYLQEQMKREKRAIGLPQEEEIVFMADRARYYIWPVALAAPASLLLSAFASEEPLSIYSFPCFVIGLLGLLVLAVSRFPDRIYLTNFRVLTRKKYPLQKEQWSAMNYRDISSISRRKKLASEQLTLKSSGSLMEIKGLTGHKLQTMLGVLHQNCTCR